MSDTLKALLADRKTRQWEVAELYADLIGMERRGTLLDWTRVNAAITARWPRGLKRVKQMAWRIVEGRVRK